MNTCLGMINTKVRTVIPLGDPGMADRKGERHQLRYAWKISEIFKMSYSLSLVFILSICHILNIIFTSKIF